MKKPQQLYDLTIPDDGSKMVTVMERDKASFESADIWICLSADCRNFRHVKVGVTVDNLRSRSYGSVNPNYFLLYVFQCYHNITEEELEFIESGALSCPDNVLTQENGLTKRAHRFES